MDKHSGINEIRQRAEIAAGGAGAASLAAADRSGPQPAQPAAPVGLREVFQVAFPMLLLILGIELVTWVHWNSLGETARGWDNAKYSHGYLVPLFAAVLLFLRRNESMPLLQPLTTLGGALAGVGALLCILPFVVPSIYTLGSTWGAPLFWAVGVAMAIAGTILFVQERFSVWDVPALDRWIGLGIVVAAEALRIWATRRSSFTPDYYSYVPALLGVFVLVGGLKILRWAGWAILFLAFMFPLPSQGDVLSAWLQKNAARASTYALETMNVQVERQGNTIRVGTAQSPLNVAEACSGLRMLTIFGALSFAVALLMTHRPLWERIVILLSSVPIALAVNIMRIVATGILYIVFPANQESLRQWSHDVAGLVMMPVALGLMFLEIQILSRIFIEEEDEDGAPAERPLTAQAMPGQPLTALPVGAALPPPRPRAEPASAGAGASAALPPVRSAPAPVRPAATPIRTSAPPPARPTAPPARTSAPPPRGAPPPKRPPPPAPPQRPARQP